MHGKLLPAVRIEPVGTLEAGAMKLGVIETQHGMPRYAHAVVDGNVSGCDAMRYPKEWINPQRF